MEIESQDSHTFILEFFKSGISSLGGMERRASLFISIRSLRIVLSPGVTIRISVFEITPTTVLSFRTGSLLIFAFNMISEAFIISVSGSIVIRGLERTSSAFTSSGFLFSVTILFTRSLSVMMPVALPFSVIMTLPASRLTISLAIAGISELISITITALFITSATESSLSISLL